jgi:hypothetical protein
LIWADIFGPMKTSSIYKARYFLVFVDDFSRKMWVYFLKQKSDVVDELKKFKVIMVEKQSGRSIRFLKTNKGGEFCSHSVTAQTLVR